MSEEGAARAGTPWSASVGAFLWPVAVLMLLYRLGQATGEAGADFQIIWPSVVAFVHGGAPYAPQVVPYTYPPGSLLLLSPLGFAGEHVAQLAYVVLDWGTFIAAVGLTMRMFAARWSSAVMAGALVGLCLMSPFVSDLGLGNVNGPVFLAEAIGLQAAVQGRWRVYGVVLGISLALKPALAALLILPLLFGNVSGALVAFLTAVVLSALAVAYDHPAAQYLGNGLGAQLGAFAARERDLNIAIPGLLAALHVPAILDWPLRLVVAAAGGFAVFVFWRQEADRLRKVAWISGVLVLVSILDFQLTSPNHGIYLFPMLASVVLPGSIMRHWVAGLGAYLAVSADIWNTARAGHAGNVLLYHRPSFGFLLLLAAAVIPAVRLYRSSPGRPIRSTTAEL